MSTVQIRTVLVIISGMLFAVYLGYKLGTDSWGLGALVCASGIYYLIMRTLRVTHETLILSFLVFGYIVGNRGFAQITPLGNLPLFLGELGIVLGSISVLLYIPFRKTLPFYLNSLSIAILVWMAIGAMRMQFDLRNYGLVAMRDFAMVYYGIYFFLAQPMARHARSRKLFYFTVAVALTVLMPTFFLSTAFKHAFIEYLMFDGAPLIFYKGDLVAAYCAAGFFFFVLLPKTKPYPIYALLGLACLATAFFTTSRAAWIGLIFGFVILFLARKRHVFQLLAVAGLIALLPGLVYIGLVVDDIEETKIYGIYEHAISLVDISGTMHYKQSRDTGSNNRYRIEWWKIIIHDTSVDSPIFGLGFGYDLANRFILEYYTSFTNEIGVRSPHSILISVYGRMGIVGLIASIFVIFGMVKYTKVAIRQALREDGPPDILAFWCMSWVIFGSACFGVVLEGPMGAIVFWIFLGVANARTMEQLHPVENDPKTEAA